MLAIKPRSDTEYLGKYILIVNNNNYSHASKKIEELMTYLYGEKLILPTMISSFEQFNIYPEMNGGFPVDNTLRAKVAVLDLELASQSVPPPPPPPPLPLPTTTTTYQVSAQRKFIWDDPPKIITTTPVPIPATSTATSYKSTVQNPST